MLVQACVTIQKQVRGHAVRRHLARQTTAAVWIQSRWRCHQAVLGYNNLRSANLRLQAWVRRWAASRHYRRIRAAVVTLQVCHLLLTSCAFLACERCTATEAMCASGRCQGNIRRRAGFRVWRCSQSLTEHGLEGAKMCKLANGFLLTGAGRGCIGEQEGM